MHNPRAPLAVCILPEPAANVGRTVQYSGYLREVLDHAGVGYAMLEVQDLAEGLPGVRVLLTVGDRAVPQSARAALREWVDAGGAWLGIGGTLGLADLFGAALEAPAYSGWGGGTATLGEGYLAPVESIAETAQLQALHQVLSDLPIPLHFFNGIPVRPDGGELLAVIQDAHGRPTDRAGILYHRVGQGHCLLLAPDLTGTVVRIQQGAAVTRDGVPAADGTAPVADGVLKSGDGAVLDWILDRQEVPGVPGLKAFLHPVADAWRDLLLRCLLFLAELRDASFPILWLYPRNLPALAHLSHDTDGNDPGHARALLDLLADVGVRSTWCVILPGYSPDLIARIAGEGHELAMHFDAMTNTEDWNADSLDTQWRQLTELFAGQAPVSNKNHYLRWEGDTEFLEWLARRRVQLDQSKGASKTGEAGFNFGTCHPYFAVTFGGAPIDVLELPTPTQDLAVFAPEALLEPLLEAVLRHHGALHLLFHPAHVDKPGVAAALSNAVVECRSRGLEWWTASEINAWERARRKVRWEQWESNGQEYSVELVTPAPLPGATILLPAGAGAVRVNGVPVPVEPIRRWGCSFLAVSLDAATGCRSLAGSYEITWSGDDDRASSSRSSRN